LLMATMKASARPMEMIERRMPLKYSCLLGDAGALDSWSNSWMM
jgi:hypothetical protein